MNGAVGSGRDWGMAMGLMMRADSEYGGKSELGGKLNGSFRVGP